MQEEQVIPEHPEVMVFASYSGPPKYPMRVTILREMVSTVLCIFIGMIIACTFAPSNS